MKTKHLKNAGFIGAWFGCLAPLVALAQPVITLQPKDQFLAPGQNAHFTFSARGGPFALQWLFEGAAITGANGYSLSLANPQPAQWGHYCVIVSNAFGSVTSQVARLKVFLPTPTPHSLSSIEAQSDGSISLALKGETTLPFAPYHDLYPLESSVNLVDWVPVSLLQRTNGEPDTLRFVDANASKLDERFYRTPTNSFLTPLPPLTGPYPVGCFSRLLTDPSRTNAVRRTNQQFMVTVWYPAIASAGIFPGQYLERQLIGPYAQNFFGWPTFASLVPAFVGHSCSNFLLSTDQVRWPVVLYSPSLTSYRRENVYKVEELASHGFIVIGLDHATTYASLFPDATVVYGPNVDQNSMSALVKDLQERTTDERFVIDQITQWNQGDPFFASHLDLQRVGAFGFSIGGATAAELCRTDSRCKAGIGMDGWFLDTNLITTPFLMFHSDIPDATKPDGRPDDRRSVIRQMTHDAYLVTTYGTVHWSHSDMPLIADKGTFQSLFGSANHPLIEGVRVNQIVSTYLVSFFKKYLRGEDDHLLDGPPSQFPEVIEFYRK